MACLAAARSPNTYFGALYRRLAARRGKKRAIVAVAHALLVAIYHLLKDGTPYQDLGADSFDRIDREALVRRSVRRLQRLGDEVSIKEAAVQGPIFRGTTWLGSHPRRRWSAAATTCRRGSRSTDLRPRTCWRRSKQGSVARRSGSLLRRLARVR